MQKTETKKRGSRGLLWAILGVVLVLALLLWVRHDRTSQAWITRYVVSHQQELEAFVAEGQGDRYNRWPVIRVDPDGDGPDYVAFAVASFGLVPSGNQRGFLWLPGGPEAGEDEVKVVTRTEAGWSWQERQGDNGGLIAPITGDWYYFEWHW